MKKRVGRPPGGKKKTPYYEKTILEELAKVYPKVLRFSDLKKAIPNSRTLTDYVSRMTDKKLSFIEIVYTPEYPRGAYKITRKGIEQLLQIRTSINIPKGFNEFKLRELIGRVLRTNCTLNLTDGVTQNLVGITLLPFEDVRREMEQKWGDETFMKETCRILHSVLFFRIRAPTQTPFAKHIEGTNVFIFRPPNYILEALQKLGEKNREIPNLDAAICYALENWFNTPETIRDKFASDVRANREKNKLEFSHVHRSG